MGKRGLKLSIIFIILIFTFSYCGGTGGDTQEASINLFIELPEEFFSDTTTELSSERESISRVLQPNLNGAVIELMITGNNIDPPIKVTFEVSTDGPTQLTVLVPPGPNILFEAKFIDGDGILMAICSALVDIVFGATNNVVLPCTAFVCTECDENPVVERTCEGERCNLDDETEICVDGDCITPTPPPTPSPTPTPAPTPTPTPRPILGCCQLGQTCANSSTLQCADMGGFFFPGAICFANGCLTAPPTPAPTPTPSPTPTPTPTPPPFPVCCEFELDCAMITNVECETSGGMPFFPASCYGCDGSCIPFCE